MVSINSLLFTTAALLSSAAAQGWEVMIYETSAGGTGSCTGGGTTISGSDAGPCHVVGLGSNAASFNILVHQDPPESEWIRKTLKEAALVNLFSGNSCQSETAIEQVGPGGCFTGSVGSFTAETVPT
ncbi:hypothetical protein R3P38DRAFT_2762604 [Favolaschia claudopus]|uniref:Uncharacterized protein n=1 Tax=Favolaschia claudopus TaxID=2862362 RepID=A0AAW0DHB9_9AGAR